MNNKQSLESMAKQYAVFFVEQLNLNPAMDIYKESKAVDKEINKIFEKQNINPNFIDLAMRDTAIELLTKIN